MLFLKGTKSENKTMKSATKCNLRNNTQDLGCERSYWCFPEYLWNSPRTYDSITALKAMQSLVTCCGPSLVPGEDITSFSRGKARAVEWKSKWGVCSAVAMAPETNRYLSEPLSHHWKQLWRSQSPYQPFTVLKPALQGSFQGKQKKQSVMDINAL